MKRLLLLCIAALPLAGMAQPYPARPVRLIVSFPAGTTPDIVARALGARLQESLGQPFVVDNRAGAGGNIGADAAAKSPADGYTLLVSTNGVFAINKALYKTLPFDPDKDLAPISLLATAPQMLVVQRSLGITDFNQFLNYSRNNPDRLSYGSVGSGSASHLTMELLKAEARVALVHVPYKGFPAAVTDMLAGSLHAMFAVVPGVLPHVKAGKMNALAVTALRRSALAPEIPSVAELGLPQLESLAWIGLAAPGGVASGIRDKLHEETARALHAPEVRELLARQGFDVVASRPEEFRSWIRAESAKWSRVIRESGAAAE